MATRQQITKAIRKMSVGGATIKCDVAFSECTLYSPKGYGWKANACTVFTVNYGYRGEMEFVYNEILETINHGVELVDDNYEGAWWE
ncbi:MAG: hypothetical protein KAS32_24100 [Candidatus Peribacteraceae bacterium]|nr:hypothetical protein [Candidatus Peribacteraceae bacterium]